MKIKRLLILAVLLSLVICLFPAAAFAEEAPKIPIASVSFTEVDRKINTAQEMTAEDIGNAALLTVRPADGSPFTTSAKWMKGVVKDGEIIFHDENHENGIYCLRLTLSPDVGYEFTTETTAEAKYKPEEILDEQTGKPTGEFKAPENAAVAIKGVNDCGELEITIYSDTLLALKEAYPTVKGERWTLYPAEEAVGKSLKDVQVWNSSGADTHDGMISGAPQTVVFEKDGKANLGSLEYLYTDPNGQSTGIWTPVPDGTMTGLAPGLYTIKISSEPQSYGDYVVVRSAGGMALGDPAPEPPETFDMTVDPIDGENCGYSSAKTAKISIKEKEGKIIDPSTVTMTIDSTNFTLTQSGSDWTVTPAKGLHGGEGELYHVFEATITATFKYDVTVDSVPETKDGTASGKARFVVTHIYNGGWCECEPCDTYDSVTGFRPRITSGASRTYYKSSTPVFETNVMYRHFSEIYIDHQLVPSVFYTVEPGNLTKVTLDNSYLQMLQPTRHVIEIVYRDGNENHTRIAMGYFRLSSATPPYTADESGHGNARIGAVALCSFAGFWMTLMWPKARKKGE